MKIVTGHYHLNPGGVTKIIQSQLNGIYAVKPETEVHVLFDGQGEENISAPNNVKFSSYSNLGYLPKGLSDKELTLMYEGILQFFKKEVQPQDILHFHNIGLGKNPLVSLVIYNLAKDGCLVINHAHDFPEDRPANLAFIKEVFEKMGVSNYHSILYPDFNNYEFGVLNSFDKNRLLEYGVPESRISLWPNPVNAPKRDELLDPEASKKELKQTLGIKNNLPIITYPVRVIRRKNIGEYILLAKLFKNKANFMVTLPPLNPVEIEYYKDWVHFCSEEDIPVIFEAGTKCSFKTVMAATDFCFTTSIMEGFGMVFVEPWLWGNPVAGRGINAVIPDIESIGVEFPLLYNSFLVDDSKEDFGFWEMEEQKQYIKVASKATLEHFIKNNPHFTEFMLKNWSKLVRHNAEVITTELSEEKYGSKLFKKYNTLS